MIKLIKILLLFFIALLLIAILSMHIMGCNTFKPITQYKDVTISGWVVADPTEIQSFTLLYSPNQRQWEVIKQMQADGSIVSSDTTDFRDGYYRLRVNLKTGAVINSNIEKIK